MENNRIAKVLQRAQAWPEDAQEELAQVAREIEAELSSGTHRASAAKLRGIDRGLRDAEQDRFATDDEVKATFAKYRGS